MQNKRYTKIDDFLNSDTFVSGVRTGQQTPEWKVWMENNPDQIHLYREAQNIVLALGNIDAPDSQETEMALAKSLEKIRTFHNSQQKKQIFPWWRAAAAAIFLLAIGLGALSFSTFNSKGPLSFVDHLLNRESVEQNLSEKIQVINLEDGSTVILQPGAKLTYPKHFEAASRKVHLSGEAFFEISKNPRRPFLVYTSDIVTRVVGTSFRIKAIDGQPDIEVLVKTGKVNISSLEANKIGVKEISVLPNESLSFVKRGKSFEKKRTVKASQRTIEAISFDFVDTPVQDIFSAIEMRYGIKVDYPISKLKHCYLSTSLSDQPLLEKLKIVCESLGSSTSFDITEDKIIIHSKGCNAI